MAELMTESIAQQQGQKIETHTAPGSVRCGRRPRWKRQAGGCGRRRRSYVSEHGASSSRRALVHRLTVLLHHTSSRG